MDDKNTTETTTTTDSTVNTTATTADSTVNTTTDSTVKAPQAVDSKPVVNESTPTTMGGGENTNMANNTTTTKKVDPKFEGCQTYTVCKGDALVDIADKFGVGLNQLRYFNGVPKATFKISEGQTIYIPNGEVKVPVGA